MIETNIPTEKKALQGREKALIAITGLAGVVILSIIAYGAINGNKVFATTTIIVAFSATILGGLVGFLFGIPKTNQIEQNETNCNVKKDGVFQKENNDRYRFNTNLEQISDWLTKILVGVGLTQINNLGNTLQSISERILSDLQHMEGEKGTVTTTGSPSLLSVVIVYFLIYGFMVGYLWTRLVYHHLLAKADNSFINELESVKNDVEKVQADTANIKSKLEIAESAATLGVGKSSTPKSIKEERRLKLMKGLNNDGLKAITNMDDPNYGRFGGNAGSNGRKLTAAIIPSATIESLFNIHLRVESTDEQNPLQGEVIFYLHDTFREPIYSSKVVDGKATLDLATFGAFTVGAIADKGKTFLELNLKEVPGAPKKFRSH